MTAPDTMCRRPNHQRPITESVQVLAVLYRKLMMVNSRRFRFRVPPSQYDVASSDRRHSGGRIGHLIVLVAGELAPSLGYPGTGLL
jgi:hypothetical protein